MLPQLIAKTPVLTPLSSPLMSTSSLIERLAQQLGITAAARTVYGEPVERDGITVIPVARVRYGFGGGGGTNSAAEEGSGGGAGVVVTPVGYIEIKQNATRFRPIRSSAASVVAVSGLVAWLLLRSVPKLLRKR